MNQKARRRSTALTVLPRRPATRSATGKPPVHSQFQKGQSGNPRPGQGREAEVYPAYAERLKEIVLEEAYRMIGSATGCAT